MWFEDDLFCQVNFWFVASLLEKINDSNRSIYLVRPHVHTQYSFTGLSQAGLLSIYKNRIPLTELGKIARLWKTYQKGDITTLTNTINELIDLYPLILPAAEAHIARIPSDDDAVRPTQLLVSIMEELKTDDFNIVFKEFSKREYIYGFGELQVKRLLDELKSKC